VNSVENELELYKLKYLEMVNENQKLIRIIAKKDIKIEDLENKITRMSVINE